MQALRFCFGLLASWPDRIGVVLAIAAGECQNPSQILANNNVRCGRSLPQSL